MKERVIYHYDKIEQTKTDGKPGGRDGKSTKSAKSKEEMKGFKGIWYNEKDRKYIVGSPESLGKLTQGNAHTVRRFDVYEGEEHFGKEFEMFLETMAVKFVRNEQYTVYPYFFDLIRLYAENQYVPVLQGTP